MKISPREVKLEALLRSSALVADGFMGRDARRAEEVIQADAEILARRGLTPAMVARRMRELTAAGRAGLGDPVETGGLRVSVEEYKGVLVCPWGHPGRYAKRVTTAERPATGAALTWTDLNVHLIEAHGFFEGRGSAFRIEPETAAEFLFPTAAKSE